jgi:hypothetical protein
LVILLNRVVEGVTGVLGAVLVAEDEVGLVTCLVGGFLFLSSALLVDYQGLDCSPGRRSERLDFGVFV